ncbi:MAG: glycosyltransferase [Candidatus Dormibacteria bacterium]
MKTGRGEVVVAMTLAAGQRLHEEALELVLRSSETYSSVVLLASADAELNGTQALLEAGGGELRRLGPGARLAGGLNQVLEDSGDADLVVVAANRVVGPGWLDHLRAALSADTTLATATAFSNIGALLAVAPRHPDAQQPAPTDAVAKIAAASLGLHPRVPTALGHCAYIPRSTVELCGAFDPSLSGLEGLVVDLSQRAARRGLAHVLADDVAAWQVEPTTIAADEAQDLRILAGRYPYLEELLAGASAATTGPLARARGIARVALFGLSVTFDASCLYPYITGTQVQALELIHAVWKLGKVRIRVVIPSTPGEYALRALGEMAGVEVMAWDDVTSSTPLDDVVHRVYQVSEARDIEVLRRLGERIVITQQDLISFRNPGYHEDLRGWQDYQKATARILDLADRAVFISEHARQDALVRELVDPEAALMVAQGTDGQLRLQVLEPRRPAGAEGLEESPFLLCLGTDYQHKNRLFALRLLEQLQLRHDWKGRLVLAGPSVNLGGSRGDEEAFLDTHPNLRTVLTRLPLLEEEEKAWLLPRAAAVVYPTVQEGFGLVPFEAAAAEVPCLFAPQASLGEYLPRQLATLQPWNAAASADRCIGVLRDPATRSQLVAGITAAGAALTWERTAATLLDAYAAAIRAPSHRLEQPRSGPTSIVVGGEALIPAEVQQALLAVARRPRLRRILFGTLRVLHRSARATGRRLRRGPLKV